MLKNKKGFSLVELIVVIGLLATIFIIVIPKVSKMIQNNKIKAYSLKVEALFKEAKINYTQDYLNQSMEYSINNGLFDNKGDEIKTNNDIKGTGKIVFASNGSFYYYLYNDGYCYYRNANEINYSNVANNSACLSQAVVYKDSYWDGTAESGFQLGTGTKDNRYIISSAKELAYLANSVNSGQTYAGKYFILGCNIYLNDIAEYDLWKEHPPTYSWTPIGDNNNQFQGNFDGNGRTIYGMYIDDVAKDYQALIGNYGNNSIYDLNIEKSYVRGVHYNGILIASASNGTVKIDNVNINKSYLYGADTIGILIGGSNDLDLLSIDNCNINSKVEMSESWYFSASLFLGFIEDSVVKVTISNSITAGKIYGNPQSAGAFVGCCRAVNTVLYNCINNANLWVSTEAGGLIGNINSDLLEIDNCANNGKIYTIEYTGGMVGYNGTLITIYKNCYNTGTIEYNDDIGSESGSLAYGIGGLEGVSRGSLTNIMNCYNSADITISYNEGSVGGLFGEYAGGEIINSYNIGTISIDTSFPNINGYSYGGLIGGCWAWDKVTVKNSYNIGDIIVTNNDATGTSNDEIIVGGAIGNLEALSANTRIENVYSVANITLPNNVTAKKGALFGYIYKEDGGDYINNVGGYYKPLTGFNAFDPSSSDYKILKIEKISSDFLTKLNKWVDENQTKDKTYSRWRMKSSINKGYPYLETNPAN